MKKSLLVVLFVFAAAMWSNAQTLANFEVGGSTLDMHGMANGHIGNNCVSVVDNPYVTGINTSAKVGKFVKAFDGDPWAGFWANSGTNLPVTITATNKYLHIKIYKTTADTVGVKFEGGPSGPKELRLPSGDANKWVEYVFDFSEISGAYPVFGFFGAWVNANVYSTDMDIYFDDIELNEISYPSSYVCIENFEGTSTIEMHGMANGHIGDGCMSVVDNPFPTTGNMSAKVGKFQKAFDGDPWGGFWSALPQAVDLTNNKYLHLKVYKTTLDTVVFKFEAGPSGNKEVKVANLKQNEWTELVFDFSSLTGVYPTIGFFGAWMPANYYTTDMDIYFDDMVLNNTISTGEVLIADFESELTSLVLHGFANGNPGDTAYIVDNPFPEGINTSSKVVKFVRGFDGNPWAGVFANLNPQIDVTNNKFVHVKVYKPRISPIKFKIEGGAAGTTETFSTSPQTTVNQWEEVVFDFSNKTGTYPIIALMPDFADPVNLTENITIYFDDIRLNSIPPVQTTPAAEFSGSPTSLTAGNTVNFTDLSTGYPTAWAWTFEGGSPESSTLKNPVNIRYNTAGTYAVTLVVTNSAGTDTEAKTGFITVTEQQTGPATIVDFEDNTWGILTYHTMANGHIDTPEAYEIVDNPLSAGINTSAKVGKFTRAFDGNPWAGFWAGCAPSVDATTNKFVHVKVLKTRISPIKFKLEGGSGTPATLEAPSTRNQTLVDTWEDMVFDFSTMSGTYPTVAFMPDFEDPITITADIVIYFDDIVINTSAVPLSVANYNYSRHRNLFRRYRYQHQRCAFKR